MLTKETKKNLIQKFAKSSNDTGSTEVQIAIISKRIDSITGHLKSFPKDQHSKVGLLRLLGKKRRLSKYLKKSNKSSYENIIKELNKS